MDELTFNNFDLKKACLLLKIKCDSEVADLYEKLLLTMERESGSVLCKATESSDSYKKSSIIFCCRL